MTVQRTGGIDQAVFRPAAEGGIHHSRGESAQNVTASNRLIGERVSLNLMGDGYIEAINSQDIEQNARQQRQSSQGMAGVMVRAPVLESAGLALATQVGRFGWKSQHSSLMSSCADSLRNELGVRNRLYPDEYSTHSASNGPTPFDTADPNTGWGDGISPRQSQ